MIVNCLMKEESIKICIADRIFYIEYWKFEISVIGIQVDWKQFGKKLDINLLGRYVVVLLFKVVFG